jgi:hypothetical protein
MRDEGINYIQSQLQRHNRIFNNSINCVVDVGTLDGSRPIYIYVITSYCVSNRKRHHRRALNVRSDVRNVIIHATLE